MFNLTPQQLQVVDALSGGATLTHAAAQAGIHRNTIANWRRNSDDFREALTHAHYDRAVLYRDRTVELADLAFEALRNVLTNPQSSPSALLRAATFIIEKIATPPKFEKEKSATMADMFAAMAETDRMHFSQQPPAQPPADAQECTTAHNDAQPEPAPQAEAQPSPVFYMHNSAQPPETYGRPEPKTGRNDLCPCGSGKKYKHCCLAKPTAGAA
jgi:transposase-like protein